MRNPHSEFLKYHGFDAPVEAEIPKSDVEIMRAEIAEIRFTMQQVLQELRKLNT